MAVEGAKRRDEPAGKGPDRGYEYCQFPGAVTVIFLSFYNWV